MWRSIDRALMAGGPLYNAEGEAGGPDSQPKGDESARKTPDDSDGKSQFDIGYGKGMDKGKRELLKELGVQSPDDVRKAIKAAQAAEEVARKQAEEQGEYKKLYEELKSKHEPLAEKVAAYEQAQKAALEAVASKLTDEQKEVLDGLPTDKALAVAKAMAKAEPNKVGGKATGGGDPGKAVDAEAKLRTLMKAGYANMTPEQRREADTLAAEIKAERAKAD